MKRSLITFAVLLSFLVSISAMAQPAPEPKEKASATKTVPEPTKKAPAAKKAEPKKVETKGEVTVVPEKTKVEVAKKEEPKGEEKGDEAEKPAAATEGEQSWWKAGLAELMKLVFAILGIMLLALVRVVMKKFGFEEQSGKINDLLTKALGYAEQKALKASKLEEGKPTSGAEKMKMAIDFAKKLAVEYKLPEKGNDWWEEKLESWLGVQKNG